MKKNFNEIIKKVNLFQYHAKTKPLIKIDHVSKSFSRFYKKRLVIDDISFNINSGEKIALLGANGAGKTTLLEMLCCIDSPTKGKIHYNYKYNKVPQEMLSIQFQEASFPAGLSVYDLIKFEISLNKLDISDANLSKMMAEFRIDEIMNYKAISLSGGQQQRVNIFLALLKKPKVLFLDELCTGLDIKMHSFISKYITNYLKDNDATMVLSSHNMEEIDYFCDRIIILRAGKVFCDMSKEYVKKNFGSIEFFIDNVLRM